MFMSHFLKLRTSFVLVGAFFSLGAPLAIAASVCSTSPRYFAGNSRIDTYSNPSRSSCLSWFSSDNQDGKLTDKALKDVKNLVAAAQKNIKTAAYCGSNATASSSVTLVSADIVNKDICLRDNPNLNPESIYRSQALAKVKCCYPVAKCELNAP
jgi:hypothetical protein